MYRPLVQPKFYHSKGQKISPGLTVVTPGGPKHRGRLLVVNPNLRNFAEDWVYPTGGGGQCGIAIVKSESVRLENHTSITCALLKQVLAEPYIIGQRYRIRVIFSEVSGSIPGAVTALLGNEGYTLLVSPEPGVYDTIVQKTTDPLGDQDFQINLGNPSNVTLEINFAALYEINP